MITYDPGSVRERAKVQPLVQDVYLVNHRKFTITLYVLITSVEPLRVYLFKEGLVFLAKEAYDPSVLTGKGWEDIHVTTSHTVESLSSVLNDLDDSSYDRDALWENM